MTTKSLLESKEYKVIATFYGERTTERSKVPLIQHINEGLAILDLLQATDFAKRAYCLHPLFQADTELLQNKNSLGNFESNVMVLVMEYRNIANAYLSYRTINSIDEISMSPLEDVNQMLRADKIQNFKDFMQYHFGSHNRSDELFQYFKNWFLRLGISLITFDSIVQNPSTEITEILLTK